MKTAGNCCILGPGLGIWTTTHHVLLPVTRTKCWTKMQQFPAIVISRVIIISRHYYRFTLRVHCAGPQAKYFTFNSHNGGSKNRTCNSSIPAHVRYHGYVCAAIPWLHVQCTTHVHSIVMWAVYPAKHAAGAQLIGPLRSIINRQ